MNCCVSFHLWYPTAWSAPIVSQASVRRRVCMLLEAEHAVLVAA